MATTSISLHLSITPSLSTSPPSVFLSHRYRRLLFQGRTFPSLSSFSPHPRLYRVSIAPVEHAPSPEFDFSGEISRLDSLRSKLEESRSLDEKVRVLDSDSRVRDFVRSKGRVLEGMGKSEAVLVKKLVAAGQEHVIGGGEVEEVHMRARGGLSSAMYVLGEMVERWSLDVNGVVKREEVRVEEMRKLLKTLGEIEEFYDCIGGIIGYAFSPCYDCSLKKYKINSNLSYLNGQKVISNHELSR